MSLSDKKRLAGLMNLPMYDPEARWYYVSCPKFTAAIVEKDGIIVETAPILKKFRGQPLENLKRWVESMGGKVSNL